MGARQEGCQVPQGEEINHDQLLENLDEASYLEEKLYNFALVLLCQELLFCWLQDDLTEKMKSSSELYVHCKLVFE